MSGSPQMNPTEPARRRSFTAEALTPRAVACGLVLGSAVCFANTYFGLQAGIVNAMPMQSALLGYALFRTFRHRLSQSLSPRETTVIEIVAGALGLAPFTSGFTAFIPAFEFLTNTREGGPVTLGIGKLILWSLATCALGVVVAAPFRRLFILRERLRFPSATATGTLIGLLFGEETIVARTGDGNTNERDSSLTADESPEESRSAETNVNAHQLSASSFHASGPDLAEDEVDVALKVLLVSLASSSAYSLVAYFLPILHTLPIFGLPAARQWLWSFDLSPAYFGYGFIIGPTTNAYTFVGAIIGWAILSPVAKHQGWAPGPVGDWGQGSRGWILWAGIGLILGDSFIGLGWFLFKHSITRVWHKLKSTMHPQRSYEETSSQEPLLGEYPDPHVPARASGQIDDQQFPKSAQITSSLVVLSAIPLVLLCLIALLVAFRKLVAPFATIVAIVLIVPAGFISMRSLGETDNGASLAIGRLAQLVVGLLVPSSRPEYMSANLLLGGLVESGASQASQHMGGQKTAYMTETAPRAVFYGQMIGTFVGTIVATLAYRIYTIAREFPSKEFEVPDAHIWLVAARFIHQQGLPDKAMEFTIATFLVGAGLSALKIIGRLHWWAFLVPSGVAMAIGMFIVPAITLPQALGSLILLICRDRYGVKYFMLLCCATGSILGQGVFSIVALSANAIHGPCS